MPINYIHLKNYKSIRDSGRVHLRPLNVLIGANGVGKSNFISFFKFLKRLSEEQLQYHVAKKGGADNLLHFGRKTSSFLGCEIQFKDKPQYSFTLEPDSNDRLFFSIEAIGTHGFVQKPPLTRKTGFFKREEFGF